MTDHMAFPSRPKALNMTMSQNCSLSTISSFSNLTECFSSIRFIINMTKMFSSYEVCDRPLASEGMKRGRSATSGTHQVMSLFQRSEIEEWPTT